MQTGKIHYSRSAFFDPDSGDYVPSRLQATGFHESQHYQQYLMDAPMWGEANNQWGILNGPALEIGATSQTISNARNLGLTKSEIYGEIDYHNYNADKISAPHWQN